MANKTNSLAHTKWMCKYHIVFSPKYRRKVIYNHFWKELQKEIRRHRFIRADFRKHSNAVHEI